MGKKIKETEKVLAQIQVMVLASLDNYQKARDEEAIKKFFPNLDAAKTSVDAVLKTWPDFEQITEAQCKSHGIFLSDFLSEILTKIKDKV